MRHFQKTIKIDAPLEKVFELVEDPRNRPEIWPGMIEVRDVKGNPKGGYDFEWVYKMAGIIFEGASETVEYVANQRIRTQSNRGINTNFTWAFESVEHGTQLTVDIMFNIPIPLLGVVAEWAILEENRRQIGTLLDNLKKNLEIEFSMVP